jgi:hypothetical protein
MPLFYRRRAPPEHRVVAALVYRPKRKCIFSRLLVLTNRPSVDVNLKFHIQIDSPELTIDNRVIHLSGLGDARSLA